MTNQQKYLLSIFIATTLFVASLPSYAQDKGGTKPTKLVPTDYPPGPPGILAQINDHFVTKQEVLDLQKQSRGQLPAEIALDTKILEQLVRSNLAKAGITVTKKEVDDAVLKARKKSGRTMARLEAMGISKETFRRSIENQLLLDKRLVKDETPKALEAYFHENRKKYLRQVRVSRLLIKINKKRSNDAALAKARALIKRLSAGEDWDKLCRRESDDELAPFDGGNLGWIPAEENRYDPVITAARSLERGKVSTVPVLSHQAYHIIKVTAERVPAVAYAEFHAKKKVAFDFRRMLLEKLQRKWLASTNIVRFSGATAPSEIFPK